MGVGGSWFARWCGWLLAGWRCGLSWWVGLRRGRWPGGVLGAWGAGGIAVSCVGAGSWSPGLLVRWEAGENGTWWGDVALVGESGQAGLQLVVADRLRPAQSAPPMPWA